jgi:hypothetical protein
MVLNRARLADLPSGILRRQKRPTGSLATYCHGLDCRSMGMALSFYALGTVAT